MQNFRTTEWQTYDAVDYELSFDWKYSPGDQTLELCTVQAVDGGPLTAPGDWFDCRWSAQHRQACGKGAEQNKARQRQSKVCSRQLRKKKILARPRGWNVLPRGLRHTIQARRFQLGELRRLRRCSLVDVLLSTSCGDNSDGRSTVDLIVAHGPLFHYLFPVAPASCCRAKGELPASCCRARGELHRHARSKAGSQWPCPEAASP